MEIQILQGIVTEDTASYVTAVVRELNEKKNLPKKKKGKNGKISDSEESDNSTAGQICLFYAQIAISTPDSLAGNLDTNGLL